MKKTVLDRIVYYTRKASERSKAHPAYKLPRAYTFRNQRLQEYKLALKELCKEERS